VGSLFPAALYCNACSFVVVGCSCPFWMAAGIVLLVARFSSSPPFGLYVVQKAVLQALHKKSLLLTRYLCTKISHLGSIFVQDGILHNISAQCLARVSTSRERRGCEKMARKAAKARWDKKRREESS
jgi:hypothetical protein